ncbi:MAG: branched-chain amino acid ABC transporter permease [Minwuia sp.]|uniref:branched-chain amino acid ABC transporter permease n=1 Tax=Minwuia sp. TaxID=2493630 RepID=UPI003A859454
MEPKTPGALFLREIWPLLLLVVLLLVIVGGIQAMGDRIVSQSLTEALIRLSVVVGLYIFVGNSGLISFGHIGFMMIGAYATAWLTMDPMTKDIFIPGLPGFIQTAQLSTAWYEWVFATVVGGVLASIVAFVSGLALMRLSGIAASIGTFALFMSFYSFYLQWSTWTAGQSSLVGIPVTTTPWVALWFAIAAMIGAFLYSRSKFGLALRASREDEVAAKAAGVNVTLERVISFSISAFFVGMAGGLYGHFLGLLTVDTFYLPLTFITLSMLVVGGMQSLSGAVIGTIALSFIIEFLRAFEKGFKFGDTVIGLPASSAEVGLGVVLLLILIFRPTGLTRNAEIYWPWKHKVQMTTVTRRQS